MKKIVISVAVIAALVGGGIFAKQKIESDVVTEIKTLIVSAPEYADVSASDIKFDLLSKELVISGIEVIGTEKLDNVVYLVDKIVLTGFNTDSLSATSGDLPLVAEEIYLENLSTTIPPALSLSYESYSIKGYKQNLALLQEALQQDLTTEEPWKRILNFTLASSEIKNYRLEDKLAGTGNLLIESSSITPAGENAYDFSIKNVVADIPAENMNIALGEFEMKALAMPTPKIMAELFKFVEEYETNPSAEPNLVADDFKMYFNQDISFTDLAIQLAQAELFSMKGLDISTQANPVQVAYELKDVKISKTAATLLEIPDLSLFLLDELLINADVELKLNDTLDVMDYSAKTSIKDFADVSYSANIKTPVPMDGLLENQFAILGSTINSFDFKYEDKGLMPRFIIYAEKAENTTLEDIQGLATVFAGAAKEGSPQYAKFIDIALQMLDKPGAMEAKLTKPTNIMELANGSFESIEASYSGGTKTLKELVDGLKASQAN